MSEPASTAIFQIVKTIMDGPGFMPSFKGKVSDPEALAIAGWLHQRFPQ